MSTDDRAGSHPDPPVTSKYASIAGSTSPGVDFISSVIAGMLIGLLIDWLAGTSPVFVIIGVIAGFVSGFFKLWATSRSLQEEGEKRGRLG